MNIGMVKELSLMLMAGAFTAQTPALFTSGQAQPQSLTEYVQAANDGTLPQDPLVQTVANLCPVIAEAAETEGAMGAHIGAACAMLQTGQPAGAEELLALLN